MDINFHASVKRWQLCQRIRSGEAQRRAPGVILLDPWRLASSKGGYEGAEVLKICCEERDAKARNLGSQNKKGFDR